jgi:hypothetical protein
MKNKAAYDDALEHAQRGSLDVNDWLEWFLSQVETAAREGFREIGRVLARGSFWAEVEQLRVPERLGTNGPDEAPEVGLVVPETTHDVPGEGNGFAEKRCTPPSPRRASSGPTPSNYKKSVGIARPYSLACSAKPFHFGPSTSFPALRGAP